MSKEQKFDFSALDVFIKENKDKAGSLIPVLHKAQELFSYLPSEVILRIADKMQIPAAKVFGVVTFYSYFKTQPSGKFNINVCLGTACFVRDSAKIVQEFSKHLNIDVTQTSQDGMFTLNTIRCIGACGLAPVVIVNEKVYGRVKAEDVSEIIDECMVLDNK